MHVSRLLLLFRFGGTYLDNDVITNKAAPKEETNPAFAIGEDDVTINNAVMRFSANHTFAKLLLDKMASPLLINRIEFKKMTIR